MREKEGDHQNCVGGLVFYRPLNYKGYTSCVINTSKIRDAQDELHSSDWGVCTIYSEGSMYLARGRAEAN